MGLLAVLGVVVMVVGFLGLFGVLALGTAVSVLLVAVGLLLAVWFGRPYVRR